MDEKPCPVCQAPMHPHMAEKYGGCTVDHGEIAELRAEVGSLRAALVCERCDGDGTIGWPDQAELCPVCGPTRRAIPGHWMHGIPG